MDDLRITVDESGSPNGIRPATPGEKAAEATEDLGKAFKATEVKPEDETTPSA